jgi:hypothetical protein
MGRMGSSGRYTNNVKSHRLIGCGQLEIKVGKKITPTHEDQSECSMMMNRGAS